MVSDIAAPSFDAESDASLQMDCWWNAATENQAIDRVHRIGQDKTVYVKHFIVSSKYRASSQREINSVPIGC